MTRLRGRYRVILLIIKKSKFLLIGPTVTTVPGLHGTLNNDILTVDFKRWY